MLPGMDGMEVLSQLRRESIFVIMLTAFEKLRLVGLTVADDYLQTFSPAN
jgi:DNA-binding response OmpR family regulator